MTLTWTKENSPRWDADKQRILGPAELASTRHPAASCAARWSLGPNGSGSR